MTGHECRQEVKKIRVLQLSKELKLVNNGRGNESRSFRARLPHMDPGNRPALTAIG